jgi:hypothetical protein
MEGEQVGAVPAEPTDEWLFTSLNTVQNVFLNWTAQLKCHNLTQELLLGGKGGVLFPPRLPQPLRSATPSLGDISRSVTSP